MFFSCLVETVGSGLKLGITFLLANLLLFSPVHAQALLSANAFGIHVANACLVWAVFFATRNLPWWLRLGFCLLFGLLGSYSAIHALAIWPAVWFLQLLGSFAGRLWHRLLFLVIWTAFGAFVIGDYFSETAPDGSLSFPALEQAKSINAEQTVKDWFALNGDLVLRGWQPPENRELDMIPGLLVVALFLLSAIGWLISTLGRSRTVLWNRCLPWVAIAASGLVGAALVCLFVARPEIPSPGLDFSLVLTPVLVGIIAIFTILTTDKVERSPESNISDHLPIVWAVILFGALLHQGGGWLQGYWQVGEVQALRLEARTQLLFLDQFPPSRVTGFGTDNVAVAKKRAHFLNRHGYLSPPLLPDLRMSYFELSPEPLPGETAALDIPKLSGEEVRFSGSAKLPGFRGRPADLVALVRNFPERNTREILKLAVRNPEDPWSWEASISNPRSEPIEFWAIDAAEMQAHSFSQRFAEREGVPVLEKVGPTVVD